MNIKWLCIASGVLLLLAIPTGWPYDFYILLRWIIFFSASYVAFEFYKSKLQTWTFIFGGLAFLFNPLLPIYLNKLMWVPIDLIGSILFFVSAFTFKNRV